MHLLQQLCNCEKEFENLTMHCTLATTSVPIQPLSVHQAKVSIYTQTQYSCILFTSVKKISAEAGEKNRENILMFRKVSEETTSSWDWLINKSFYQGKEHM